MKIPNVWALFFLLVLLGLGCSGTTSTSKGDPPPDPHDPLLTEMLHERDRTQQVINDFAVLQKDRYLAGEITKEEMRSLIDMKYRLEKEKLSKNLEILEGQAQE